MRAGATRVRSRKERSIVVESMRWPAARECGGQTTGAVQEGLQRRFAAGLS